MQFIALSKWRMSLSAEWAEKQQNKTSPVSQSRNLFSATSSAAASLPTDRPTVTSPWRCLRSWTCQVTWQNRWWGGGGGYQARDESHTTHYYQYPYCSEEHILLMWTAVTVLCSPTSCSSFSFSYFDGKKVQTGRQRHRAPTKGTQQHRFLLNHKSRWATLFLLLHNFLHCK